MQISNILLVKTFPRDATRVTFQLLYGAWLNASRPDTVSIKRANVTSASNNMELAIGELQSLGIVKELKGHPAYFTYSICSISLLNAVGGASFSQEV